jgi:serine protease Do
MALPLSKGGGQRFARSLDRGALPTSCDPEAQRLLFPGLYFSEESFRLFRCFYITLSARPDWRVLVGRGNVYMVTLKSSFRSWWLVLSGCLGLCLCERSVLSAQEPLRVGTEPLQPSDVARLFEQAQIDVFKKAASAVVILEAELLPDVEDGAEGAGGEAGAKRASRSEGSGFVVRANGVIVTNHHVIAKAQRIVVRFRDGRRLDARVLGSDERTDLAVLQVEAAELPVLEFADSDAAAVGQLVYAIGIPFGQEWSFTAGMLSGKGRTRLLAPTSILPLVEDYLQTDALINPGHSGGPLLDREAHVLGMNTLITRTERGLAFAVPSNLLQQTVSQILAAGKVSRPWLGIRVETLGETQSLGERLAGAGRGAVVLAVEAEGPAFRTDLRPADVIQSVDGKSVGTALELQRELSARKVGQPVRVGVWRMGTLKTVSVPLAELPPAPQLVLEAGRPQRSIVSSQERFGLKLREVKGHGVRVEGVESTSASARAGLLPEDVVTEVDNRPVRTVADCLGALRSGIARSTAGVLVQLERQGLRTFVLLRAD